MSNRVGQTTSELSATSATQNQRQEHYVVAGETLSELALKYLGNASRWPELVAMNPQALKNGVITQDGHILKWGNNLVIRNGTGKPVQHKGVPGETAQDLAARFLDDPDRWQEILAANPGEVAADGTLKPGSTFTIPNHGPAPASPAATKAAAALKAAKANPDNTKADNHTQWQPAAAKAAPVTSSTFVAAPPAPKLAPPPPGPNGAPPPPGPKLAPPPPNPAPPPPGPTPNINGKGQVDIGGGVLSGQVQAVTDSTGIKTGTALVGFKTAIGTEIGPDGKPVPNTNIDVTNGVTITNNKLTKEQFEFVIGSQFGMGEVKNIKVNADNSLTWTAGQGVSAALKDGFTAAYKNLTFGDDANLTVNGGQISGTDKASVSGFFNNSITFAGQGAVTLTNDKITAADISANISQTFGPKANPTNVTLTGEVQETTDPKGVKTGTAVLGFKEAIGTQTGANGQPVLDPQTHQPVPNTTISVTNGVTITNNALSKDDFAFVIGSQFGQDATKNIKVNADGKLEWAAGQGFSGALTAGFTAAYNNLKIGDDANLTVNGGQLSGTDKATVNAFFNNGLQFGADNTVTLKNGQVTEDDIDANITQSFGPQAKPTASLSAELKANIDSTGIKSGTAVLGFKEAIGTQPGPDGKPVANTTINVTNGITITNNKLTADDFAFVIGSQFGQDATKNIKVNANGNLEWTAGQGVSGTVQAGFTAAYNNLKIGNDANLSLKDNQVSGTDKTNISGFFKNGVEFAADNTVTLKNGQVTADDINANITQNFGPKANPAATLNGELKATIDSTGIKSATAVLGFKEAIGTQMGPDGKPVPNTTIDVTNGITITNNKLTADDFAFVIGSQFGQDATKNIKVNANGNLEWTAGQGVSGTVEAGFTAAYNNLKIGNDANLALKDNQVSGTDKTSINGFFKNGIQYEADNTVTLKNGQVTEDDINANITQNFGPKANPTATLSGELKATIDPTGIKSATAVLGFKEAIGAQKGPDGKPIPNTTINVTNGITITNNKLTADDFAFVIGSQFGQSETKNIKVNANGQLEWKAGQGVSGTVQAGFTAAYNNLKIGNDANLTLKNGQVSGTDKTTITNFFNNGIEIGATNTVTLKNGQITQDDVQANIRKSFGPDANPTASISGELKATVANGQLVDAAASLAAVKTLKAMNDAGQIKISANGSIELERDPKTGVMTSAEDVAGLISLAANKEATVTSGAQAHFADGSFDSATFNEGLGVTVNNTQLTSSGTFTLQKDPKTGKINPVVAATVGAMFNMGPVQAGVDIKVAGVDQQQINLKMASAGKNAKVNGTGGLDFQSGHLTGAQLNVTTGLLSGGKSLGDVTLGGGFVVTKDAKNANINLGANIGPFAGSLGVAASATTKLYTPDPKKDPQRAADTTKGGAWSDREATFNITGSAGANINVPVGGVPVTLGFKADGSKGETVRTLTLEPNATAAQSQPPVLVMHPPKSVADILAMKTHEEVSQSGNQSIGMAGNVAVGYAAGVANISVGGSVYHQISGDMSRDIERLDGNKVRVRFSKGSGSTSVATLSATVGLNADKALPGSIPAAIKDKAKPLIEQIASAGISDAWSKVKQNETTFDVTIDLSTPQGKAAMEHLLKNDLSEAQYWSGYNKSGVTLNSSVTTDVNAKKNTADVHIGTLDWQHVSSWLDAEKQTVTPGQYTVDEAQDRSKSTKALFPFDPSRSTDMRLTHETSVSNGALPDVDAISKSAASGQLQVRTPPPPQQKPAATLADSKAVLGMRITQSEKDAGLNKLEGDVNPALAFLNTIGVPSGQSKNLQNFGDALGAGLVPNKKPLVSFLPFGDKRFGSSSIDYEVFVSPQGLQQMANSWDTSPTHYQMNYLLTQGNLDGKGSIFSRAGMLDAMQKTMGASIVPDHPGQDVTTYTVTPKSGAPYKITSDQLETLRLDVVNFKPPQGQDNWQASFGLSDGKTKFTITSDQWRANSDILKRSQVFGREMSAIATSYNQNAPPTQRAGESAADFQKRKAAWKPGPLFNNPEAFWAQASQHFENITKSENGNRTAAATIAVLAGSDKIFAKAELKTDATAAQAMVNAGRTNVQHFAAVDLLAVNGAKVYTVNANGKSQPGLVFNTPPGNVDAVTAAAKNLFGPNVQVTRNGAQVTISGIKWPSNQYMNSLYQFLNGVKTQGTHMIPSAAWSQTQTQQILSDVFGNSALVYGGNVVFDNRGYGSIHFGDAIQAAGPAFVSTFGPEQVSTGNPPQYKPPARFPLLVPVTDEGKSQATTADVKFSYKGANADWGSTTFGNEAFLHGTAGNDSNDPSVQTQPGPTDWILTGQ
jgi:hypothetical protein